MTDQELVERLKGLSRVERVNGDAAGWVHPDEITRSFHREGRTKISGLGVARRMFTLANSGGIEYRSVEGVLFYRPRAKR